MKRFFILCVAIVMMSCSPFTKDGYLDQYAEFMEEISVASSDYTEPDWAKADEKFQRFSEEWFNKFSSELTDSEKMTLAGYQLKYAYYKGLSKSGDWFKGLKKSVGNLIQNIGPEVSNGLKHLENELKEMSDTLSWEQLLDDAAKQIEDAVESYDGDLLEL